MASKNWAFTSFEEKEPAFNDSVHRYMIYQQELCPETKKLHWQGFVIMDKRVRMTTVKDSLGSKSIHVEQCKGSAEQNREYCTKSKSKVGEAKEFGHCPKHGERIDLQKAGELAIEGKYREIPFGTYIRYNKGLEKLANLHNRPKKRENLKVYVFWGESGCGKSYNAHKDAGEDFYSKPNGPWWDGYTGEKNVIFDEFEPDECKLSEILKWMDVYPLSLPVKGGFVPAMYENLWITAHKNPLNWYSSDRTPEIMRRITEIKKFTEVYKKK